ncbi:MAG TPA: hypothetical protein VE988_17100 [Gemmataceae bacterium]|nr:hypothetical protein [Gemmataceae bacterium]
MRYLLAMALLTLPVPVSAQPNEAEKIFRAFEKKLTDAKAAYKIAFEYEGANPGPRFKAKGELLIANGDQIKLTYTATEGGIEIAGSIVSNGQKMKVEGGGKDVMAAANPQLTKYVKGYLPYMPAGGIFVAIEAAERGKPEDAPDKIKATGFKLAGKEKIGNKETQIVEFTVDRLYGNGPVQCKIWFDVKTNMPLKRVFDMKEDGMAMRLVEQYASWEIDPKLTGDEFKLAK